MDLLPATQYVLKDGPVRLTLHSTTMLLQLIKFTEGLCYSGKFICMRLPPDIYDLKQGVFLFLGCSELDERKLKAINQKEVQDAVPSLQDLLRLHIKPKTPCMLALYNTSDENAILVAKLIDNSTLTRPLADEPNPSLLLKHKIQLL